MLDKYEPDRERILYEAQRIPKKELICLLDMT